MRELRDLLHGHNEHVALDVAALQLAKVEYPDLSVDLYLSLLDSYAAEAAERIPPETKGLRFLDQLNEFLFEELGFSGSTADYYHPANSCLNEVLTRRSGLPISLSVVYMEIARRLNRRVSGIGLPGHFVVRYVEPGLDLFVDPFHSGRLMSGRECLELSQTVTGVDVARTPQVLNPVSNRHILIRMLNNLRGAYFRLQDRSKAVRVLDLLIEALPEPAEEHKQRGLCLLHLQDLQAARQDLEMYLKLSPGAHDREEILLHLDFISQRGTLQ
ncbi:MAG TPA: transglutaminase-like domain-containing protein [Bryobacteraceae bacterium]|nr:transglutaminase-like domain-containing protein [Bryobacteraceae bacterium]